MMAANQVFKQKAPSFSKCGNLIQTKSPTFFKMWQSVLIILV